MKKLYFLRGLFLAVSVCSYLSSCSSSDEGDSSGKNSGPLTNAFAYDEAVHEIGSVVYTTIEKEGYHSFYLSPTKGLVDMDAMLLADDYIKIVVANPKGNVDLASGDNALDYKDVSISSATSGDVSKADLTLTLTSARTMKMSLDAAMKSGRTLRAEYDGFCKQYPQGNEDGIDIALDKSIFALYFGKAQHADTDNYYLILTDATFITDGSRYQLTSSGYELILDLYAAPGESWRDMATGVYEPSDDESDHTYMFRNSGVKYTNTDMIAAFFDLSGPVTVARDADGITTISATFYDESGEKKTIVYKNELKLMNTTSGATLPQISDDVVLESYSAAAYYHGNMLQGAAGLMQINIFDKTYAEGEEGSGGYSVSLFVFNDLFSNPKDAVITPGEYKPATNFTWGTWMPAQEIPIGGGAIPIGTYAHRDDLAGGGMGSFSYAAAGQITISDAGDGQFTVEFDLEAREGCVIKGSYTGEIPITDLSDDKSDDDGTSTLIRDYEMDLSHIKEASMHNRETTWIGWDYLPVKDYGCASQIINIGTEANPGYPEDAELDEKGYAHADIMRIELLVEPGTEGMITPGEYPVTPTRFPESFKPGVCARGIILGDEGVTGTRWMRVYSEYAYMEGHACIYDGSIIIEDAGNDEFEIRIKGICVRKHNVTGTWKGRILDGAGNPVKSSGKRVEAKQPRMPHTYPASAVLSAVPEKQNFASNRK